jgi:anti-sigma regulatory factor (Ser/Thr protein kinase)
MAANHQVRAGRRPVDEEPLEVGGARRAHRRRSADTATSRVDWRISVPGVATMVGTARRLARAALNGSPRADDLELIISELVTNAIRHTPSGCAGASVSLRVIATAGWARVEVRDLGDDASWSGRTERPEEAECGRGLVIVNALADRAGREAVTGGQLVWAELRWADARDATGDALRWPQDTHTGK